MANSLKAGREITGVGVRWAIGFAGSLAAIFVLPRLMKLVVRHYAFRLMAEIVAIVSFGLLAEKVVQWTAESGRELEAGS